MKACVGPLLDFLREAEQITIPIFQRPYCWAEHECEQLWRDLVDAGKNEEIKTHFFGSIVYYEQDGSNAAARSFHVIDGQQRLTTVSLLLELLARNNHGKKIREEYLLNPRAKTGYKYKLSLTETDNPELLAVLGKEGGNNETSRVLENLECFEKWLKESKSEDALGVLCQGLEKLQIVRIELTLDIDNPQLVFESMNAKGVALRPIDLIRNFILMQLGDKQESGYKEYWLPMDKAFKGNENYFEFFMRHYLRMRTGRIWVEDGRYLGIYEIFKKYYNKEGARDVMSELRSIYQFACYYCAIVFGKQPDKLPGNFRNVLDDERVKKALDAAGEIGTYHHATPFLLNLYDCYNEGELDSEHFARIIRLLESYLFRRGIFGSPINKNLENAFASFIPDFEDVRKRGSGAILVAVKDRFKGLSEEKGLGEGYRFPDEGDFKKDLIKKGVYERLKWCELLLRRLEWKAGGQERKGGGADEKTTLSIEHIMPQTITPEDSPSEDAEEEKQREEWKKAWRDDLGTHWENKHRLWLHTLGNLTLVSEEENTRLSNRPFNGENGKRKEFENSAFQLTRELAKFEKWDADAIEQRGKNLAELAVEIWPGLNSEKE